MSSGIRSIRAAPRAVRPQPREQLHVPRIISALLSLALVGALLIPPSAFAGTRNWTLTRTPASVPAGPGSVQLTATNTGDDGGSEAVGCVVISVPNAGFSVSGVTIDALSDPANVWSATYAVGASDTLVTLRSSSKDGGNSRLSQDEWIEVTVSFTTTGADGTYSWVGNVFNKDDCTDDFFMTRTVSVTTNGAAPNSAPAGQPDSYRVAQGGTLSDVAPGVLANDSDPDGDPLQAVSDTGPTSGASLTLDSDGSFTYTPPASFVGTDSFTYRASDGILEFGPIGVSVTVSAVPIAEDDPSYVTTRDTALNVVAPNVLSNDVDAELDPLTASLVTGASNGTVTLNVDGSFTYVPDAGFVGTDSFTYAASDGVGTSNAATVTIIVVLPNLAPLAVADAYAATEDTTLSVPAPGLLGNDSDPNGDPLTATLVTQASNGTATVNADGSFTYLPATNFAGIDTFTYDARDADFGSAPASVTITVNEVNDAPESASDTASTAHGTSVDVDVLANDTDVDGDALAIDSVSQPASGTVSIVGGRVRYQPASEFSGVTSFSYVVTDGDLADTALVTITVAAPAPTPTASPAPPTPTASPAPPTPTANPAPTPNASPAPTVPGTSGPAAPSAPVASPAPASPPAESATPKASQSATPSTFGSTDAGPAAEPRSPPPGAQPTPPPVDDGELIPLTAAELTAGAATQGTGFGGLDGLFTNFSSGFSWAVPAAILGLPGLLFMIAVGGQLVGAAVWVPAVRRSLGGIGLARRRREQVAT